jgi:CheY-like chemotaxis protein
VFGAGCRFHFGVRFESTAQRLPVLDPTPPKSADPRLALRGTKILLAEDNQVNQLIIRELLGEEGADLLIANDGREAVALLQANPDVKLVLMDCQMPVMDGFAATRAIRADARHAHLPILALTANLFAEDLRACIACGMSAHIAKPFNIDELYTVLAHWLGQAAPPPAPPGH